MRNWRIAPRPWSFAALASLALAATPAARAQVKLEYKYPEGQKLTYKLSCPLAAPHPMKMESAGFILEGVRPWV